MKYSISFLSLITIVCFVFSSCQDVLNIPLRGSIQGYVIDGLTKDSIENVMISAEFIQPNDGAGEEATKMTTTTNKGFFRLDDVWDRVRITVSKPGFQSLSFDIDVEDDKDTNVDLEIRGIPKIFATTFDTKELFYGDTTTSDILLEIEDRYNDAQGVYTAIIFFYDLERDFTVTSAEFTEIIQSSSFSNMGTTISVAQFPEPTSADDIRTYGYFLEITDPDGNSNQYFNTEADGDIIVYP